MSATDSPRSFARALAQAPRPATSSAFETARDFAAHGLPVFPCHTITADGGCTCGSPDCDSPGKHPRIAQGFKAATTDERALLQWDARFAGANWAVACGGAHISVVDVDTKAGADPKEVIADYELAGPIVWTGEALDGELEGVRGAHIYCANGCRTGPTGAAGVEVRAAGAYVLLPGSRHASGVTYAWADDARPWTVDLRPVPETLVVRRPSSTSTKADLAPAERVGRGGRHSHLKDFAVALVRVGVTDPRIIEAHLWTQYREACDRDPVIPDSEIAGIAGWAAGSDIAARERETQTAQGHLERASRILGLPADDPFVQAWRQSPRGSTPLAARTRSGVTIRWDAQRDMLRPDELVYPILAVPGWPGPDKLPLSKALAMEAYRRIVDAITTYEQLDARDEIRQWLEGFERIVAETIEEDFADAEAKHRGARHLQHYQPLQDDHGRRRPRYEAPAILRDTSTGDVYIGHDDLLYHLRKDRRETISGDVLEARMSEIGWEKHLLQTWQPGIPKDVRTAAHRARITTFRHRGADR